MPSIVYDAGCVPFPVRTITSRAAVRENGVAGFSRSRQIYSRPRRSVELTYNGISPSQASVIESIYRTSKGGVLPMSFTHPDGSGDMQVVFASAPVAYRQTGARTIDVTVTLEEVL